ncbi:MAG: hypothetical protein E6J32_02215 [Chloroflexi bacterium]|nr:MAG: hypothetical protein E6J32_02215 [Chloroflexota bacterium]
MAEAPPRKRASAAKGAGWSISDWWTNGRQNGWKVAAVVGGLILLLMLGTFAYAYATLPDPSKLDLAAGTVIIKDRSGALIEERNAQGARVDPVRLADISTTLRNATVAVEDKHFYQHHGIDWGRVIKAGIIDTLARRPEQGASTITEQLAKIAVLQSPKKSILIKLREAMVATSLESRYTKNQILEMYLNTIFYGHHATGIEAASQVYFGKHASELNLAEASMLAGLPNAPSYYDPLLHRDRAKARQAVVLDAMLSQQMISQAQADEAKDAPLTFVFKENRSSQAPHFVDFVFEQLENLYGPSVVNRGGFVVTTTLDLTPRHGRLGRLLQQRHQGAVQRRDRAPAAWIILQAVCLRAGVPVAQADHGQPAGRYLAAFCQWTVSRLRQPRHGHHHGAQGAAAIAQHPRAGDDANRRGRQRHPVCARHGDHNPTQK